jgi:hypothetical protein
LPACIRANQAPRDQLCQAHAARRIASLTIFCINKWKVTHPNLPNFY